MCFKRKKKSIVEESPIKEKNKSKEETEFDPTQDQAKNASDRDHQYTKVICDYVEHQRKVNKDQRWFKTVFFYMVCGAFLTIIVVCLYVIITIVHKGNIEWEDFAVVLTSVVSLISVVNVLPEKIAEHLFPTGGDKDITEFIINMNATDKRKKSEERQSDTDGKKQESNG